MFVRKYCQSALVLALYATEASAEESSPDAGTVGALPLALQSCPSASGYFAQPPIQLPSIDPVALLSAAPSACMVATNAAPCAPHHVYRPNATAPVREPLVVFLPGTMMEPDKHDLVLATAAYAGYRTIGLSYDNSVAVEKACAGVNACGSDCMGLARTEAVLGTDVSTAVTIQRGDSVLERLYRVLVDLETSDPTGGWSNYYVSASANITPANIVWSNIIIAGFSQGAGHSALVSRLRQVHGLVLLDGGNDTCVDPLGPLPAEWTTTLPDASAGRPKYGVTHRRNAMMPFEASPTWQALGIARNGISLDGSFSDLIDSVPPSVFSFTNQNFAEPPVICSEHMSMARDQCLPANIAATVVAASAPESRLFVPYLSRFCYACDRGTCP